MTAGVPREARSLNGHDIGREVKFQHGDDLSRSAAGRIISVEHHRYWTDITIGPGPATTYAVHPHDLVRTHGGEPHE